MPEYLAPGVFVEEVSYRSKSIQGVPTSTTGFAGLTHYGPVHYPGGPRSSEPRLVTCYAEFERIYGDLRPIELSTGPEVPYLAHAARAFFLNGGRRLYVSRIYHSGNGPGVPPDLSFFDVITATDTAGGARLRSRFPGKDGDVSVQVSAVRGGDVGLHRPAAKLPRPPTLKDLVSPAAVHATIVELIASPAAPKPPSMPVTGVDPIVKGNLRFLWISMDRKTMQLIKADGTEDQQTPASDTLILPITVTLSVFGAGERHDVYPRLNVAPQAAGSISRVLSWNDPADDDGVLAFEYMSKTDSTVAPPVPSTPIPPGLPQPPPTGVPSAQDLVNAGFSINVLTTLIDTGLTAKTLSLTAGTDGDPLTSIDYQGMEADPDDADKKATGLKALAEVDDIAIVALPGATALQGADEQFVATQYLIEHAEECRYRIAVVDGPRGASINAIRNFRGNFDSKYAAIYHPWIEILDPNGPPSPGVPTPRIELPPSGFVAGVYARTDITRGVFKAPANEVVYGLTRFEMNINQGRDEVLNPENINALRLLPGRGSRVWGARTMSSDPEWLYVNVRRLFIYLEHSIDKATQWAVFEPNGEALWRNITRTVSDFLEVQWLNGALMGASPDEAFFVLCDRSTMSQNDLDNGRLICLIGVAPVKPAEFVIFRIGQWTADAQG
jgi:phage tail sheath protein FI